MTTAPILPKLPRGTLTRIAEQFDVSISHVSRVWRGERVSKRILVALLRIAARRQ